MLSSSVFTSLYKTWCEIISKGACKNAFIANQTIINNNLKGRWQSSFYGVEVYESIRKTKSKSGTQEQMSKVYMLEEFSKK